MTLMLRTKMFALITILGLVLAGCGSSTKKPTENNNPEVTNNNQPDTGSSMLDRIQVNSDSDSGNAGALRTVRFDFNSSVLTADASSALRDNAEFLRTYPSVEVQIEGHCDERGGVQFNLALGEARAKAIRRYLVGLGISGSRMTTISFGKERPLAFGHNESAWSQNRRGNFVITGK